MSLKAKPTLIIVPPGLVYQWVDELHRATSKLKVYIYYGDYRKKSESNATVIDRRLTRDHELFDGHASRAKCVVITAYQSWALRHGPSAITDWRVSKLRMKVASARLIQDKIDPSWPGYLGGCFEQVILDEAHLVKNSNSNQACAVAWLDADFHVCLTATPIYNSLEDFSGFLPLLLPRTSIWTEENLKRFGVDETVNPFDLPHDHPASILQLSKKAQDKFI